MGQRVVLREYGEDPIQSVDDFMDLTEQERPTADSLGPEDISIAVHSAAVGWVDLIMASGQYQHMVPPPYTPGLEFAGVVDEIGASVTHVSVGDRVIADGFKTGPRSSGRHQDGGFASYAVADQGAVMPLPESLTMDQGANLLGNYETAYHCLIARGRLSQAERVLILSASGATGLAAVHVAKAVGAEVLAVGRTEQKLALVEEQGADAVIHPQGDDVADQADALRQRVKELTAGEGVDVVYDPVDGDLSVVALRNLRFGGRFLVVGWAATPDVAGGKGRRGAPRANQLTTNLIMMKGLDVLGCPTVISTVVNPAIRAPRLEQILAWAATGDIQPVVSADYGLGEYSEALLAKWESRFVGGIVLHPTDG